MSKHIFVVEVEILEKDGFTVSSRPDSVEGHENGDHA